MRDVFSRWNEGERDFDEAVFEESLTIHSALTGDMYEGIEGLQTWAAEIDDQFKDWNLVVEETESLSDDRVLVIGEIQMTGRQSDVAIEQPASWVVDLMEGRVAVYPQLHRPEGGGGVCSERPVSERLFDTFTRLCEITSDTGDERDVADWIRAQLEGFGFEVEEDDSAERADSNTGNLICRIPGRSETWVSFFAHMDTVPHSEPIKVVLADGVFRSAGETILGADNKAAVAVLMELAANARNEQPACGLELVFTVAEEEGLRGAREIDVSALRAPFGYVFDHATPIGEIITAAPTYNKVVAEFEGIEAHSGIRPEVGRSAIEAAASAVGRMELGRLDDETTANVGVDPGRDGVERRRGLLQARLRGAEPQRGEGGRRYELDRRCVHLGCDRERMRCGYRRLGGVSPLQDPVERSVAQGGAGGARGVRPRAARGRDRRWLRRQRADPPGL